VRAHGFAYVHPREVKDGFYECGVCGALVLDRFTHRDWHHDIDKPEVDEP
jgi:hypothetical protein